MPYAANLEKLALPIVKEVVEAVKAVTYDEAVSRANIRQDRGAAARSGKQKRGRRKSAGEQRAAGQKQLDRASAGTLEKGGSTERRRALGRCLPADGQQRQKPRAARRPRRHAEADRRRSSGDEGDGSRPSADRPAEPALEAERGKEQTMSQPVHRPATYADLEAVPPHLVAEIIDGELVTHPRPSPRHSATAARARRRTDWAFPEGPRRSRRLGVLRRAGAPRRAQRRGARYRRMAAGTSARLSRYQLLRPLRRTGFARFSRPRRRSATGPSRRASTRRRGSALLADRPAACSYWKPSN